jgi:lysine-N-methylase
MPGPGITPHRVEAEDVRQVRQPNYFDHFRCTGAHCEDTCCAGWEILVDQRTYQKYQNLPGHRIADTAVSNLVQINPARSSTGDFAKFRMEGERCPALEDGWCAIQQTLGESYIPDLCSKYPRVLNVVGEALESSLHLSCPEAARLVLTDPQAMVFRERLEEPPQHRSGSLNWMVSDPEGRLHQVRTLVIEWIQERSIPLWQRIVSLGFAIDELAGVDMVRAAAVLKDHLAGLRRGSFDEVLAAQRADPTFQLKTVLELVVTRVRTDHTSPRFLECGRDFMRGLGAMPGNTIEELAARYEVALRNDFLPFIRRNEHLLENYLVNYIFRTVFPYRSRLPVGKFAMDSSGASLKHSFILLAAHFAIIRTMLIGLAALHQDDLSIQHAIKLVQSYSKAFMHSTSFEATVIEHLEKDPGNPAGRVAALVMD